MGDGGKHKRQKIFVLLELVFSWGRHTANNIKKYKAFSDTY